MFRSRNSNDEEDLHTSAKIGVFGIGLAAYWPQFEGLKERLEGYQAYVEQQVAGMGARIVSAGLVDTAPAAQQAGELFARENVDLIVCYVGTYATSSQVLPAVQRSKAPVLVLNCSQRRRLTIRIPTRVNGWRIARPAVCRRYPMPLPAAASLSTWSRALRPVGTRADRYYDRAWAEIANWVAAAGEADAEQSALGFLGHTSPGMLDMCSDFTMTMASLGCTLRSWRWTPAPASGQAEADKVNAKIAKIRQVFDGRRTGPRQNLPAPSTKEACVRRPGSPAGLDRLVADFDLNGLTYYYRGLGGNANEELGGAA